MRMTHPDLPGQPIEATQAHVTLLEKSGWTVDAVEGQDPDGALRPADSARKPAWVDYAVSKGADREAAEALTIPQLIAAYGSD